MADQRRAYAEAITDMIGLSKCRGPPSERAAASVLSGLRTCHAHVIPDGLTSAPAGPPDGYAIDQNAGAAVLRATTSVLKLLCNPVAERWTLQNR